MRAGALDRADLMGCCINPPVPRDTEMAEHITSREIMMKVMSSSLTAMKPG